MWLLETIHLATALIILNNLLKRLCEVPHDLDKAGYLLLERKIRRLVA